jgi:hypothetical protein
MDFATSRAIRASPAARVAEGGCCATWTHSAHPRLVVPVDPPIGRPPPPLRRSHRLPRRFWTVVPGRRVWLWSIVECSATLFGACVRTARQTVS